MMKLKKSSPKLVKMMNRELIINELKQHPRQSRADLAKKTRLSKPTVSDIVKELIEEDLVFEAGVGPSSGGKKPIYLEYNSRSNYVIGILIENETIFIALGDMNGDIITLHQKKFKPLTEGHIIVDMITEGIIQLVTNENIKKDKVLGIVIGVSGIKMDEEDVICSSPTINWGNIHLREEINNRLQMEVIIENDVNLMTIGEFHKGQGEGIQNFVYLFIGNGIGSGLILDGKFYKGHHSASGEIGYMMIGDETKLKPDLGVFETNYGLFGVSERVREQKLPIDEEISLLLFLQKNRTDEKIAAILDDVIYQWAKATINIVSIIDPQAVIMSGELSHMDTASLNLFKETIEKYVPKIPELKFTKLGYKAGIYGAFHLALDYFHITGFKQNK